LGANLPESFTNDPGTSNARPKSAQTPTGTPVQMF
jgi:hypothetical protein